MNEVKGMDLTFALLDWAKIQYDLTRNTANEAQLKNNLIKLEEHLLVYGIEKPEIIHEAPEYYTIEFSKDGILEIKEFSIADIEKNL